jgi:hypothetical protein
MTRLFCGVVAIVLYLGFALRAQAPEGLIGDPAAPLAQYVMNGNNQNVALSIGEPTCVKVLGSKNMVSVNVGVPDAPPIDSLEIYVDGVGNRIDLRVCTTKLGVFEYVVRGNKNEGTLSVSRGAATGRICVNMVGKSDVLTIRGPGNFT